MPSFVPVLAVPPFDPGAIVLIVGAIGIFVIVALRDYRRSKLEQAAIEKGLHILPTGAPLWLASLKKGILVFTFGVGLLIVGVAGFVDANHQIADAQAALRAAQDRFNANPVKPNPAPVPGAAATSTAPAATSANPMNTIDEDQPPPPNGGFRPGFPPPGPGGRGPNGFGPGGPNGGPGPGPNGPMNGRGPNGPMNGPGNGPPLQQNPPPPPEANNDGGLRRGNPEAEHLHHAADLRQLCTYGMGAGAIIALLGLVLTLFSLLERKYVLPITPAQPPKDH